VIVEENPVEEEEEFVEKQDYSFLKDFKKKEY
jgi:hypothetical protein